MLRGFLATLRSRGLTLWLDTGALKFKALHNAPLTAQDKAFLRENKADVIEWLAQNPEFFSDIPLSENQKSLWLVYQANPQSAAYNLAHTVRFSSDVNLARLQQAYRILCQRHDVLRTAYREQNGQSVQRILNDFQPDFAVESVNDQANLVALAQAEADKPFHLESGNVCRAKVWTFDELAHSQSSEKQANKERVNAHQKSEEQGSAHQENGEQASRTPTDENKKGLAFQLTVHHIAADFWSCEVLFDDLLDIYQALDDSTKTQIATPLNGDDNHAKNSDKSDVETALVEKPRFDYFAWSVEQQQWRDSDAAQAAASYWKAALGQKPSVLEVPTDKPRPATQSFHGEMLPFAFDAQQSQGIREVAKQLGVTPFVLCFAAYQVLLYRYSGQAQFNIGTPTSGRLNQDYLRTIGYLVNPVVLACECSPNATFAETVEQAKHVSRSALEHQQWPLSQLMPMLDVQRDPSRNPLFQHLFALTHVQAQKNQKLIEETYLSEQRGAALDISLIVLDDRNGFTGEWRYNTDLYQQNTALTMIEAYKAIVDAVCANPNATLKSLPLMQENTQQAVLQSWAKGPESVLSDDCIHTLIEAQAARVPNATALVFEGESVSYGELNQRANQLAHYLVETQRVRPDTRVGLYFERSIDMVVSMLAVLKSGAAFVPLDPDYPKARLSYLCDDADLTCVLSHEAILQQGIAATQANEQSVNWISVDADSTTAALQHYPTQNIALAAIGLNARHLAYVIFTSGSTGKPKGVMVEHAALVNQTQWIDRAYPADENDRFLLKTPFSFDVSQSEFMWALSTGSTLVIAKPQGHKDPVYLTQLIQQEKITKAHFVPALLAHTLALGDLAACTSLKQVFCAGEALPANLVTSFYQTCPHATLYNLYGPTEATIFTTHYRCDKAHEGSNVPIGKPVQNTQLYVLDAHMQPVPKGAIGELYIGGDCLARGYLNSPALTQTHFIHGQVPGSQNTQTQPNAARLYKTGDLVRWLSSGDIEYVGRADSQVKLRGLRIELGEIESAILQQVGVKEAVVVVQTSANQQQHLVAYVVPDSASSQSQALDQKREQSQQQNQQQNLAVFDKLKPALIQALSHAMPDYMVPSAWVMMPQLPLSPNGKIDKNALPKADFTDQKAQYRAPESHVEKQLAKAWESALDINQVGRDDSFFALGGNSLSATRALAELQSTLGVQVSLKTWFENPVLSQLANAIETQISGADASSVAANQAQSQCQAQGGNHFQDQLQTQEGELYPLSFSQQRLWFIDRMEPGNTLYNLFFTLKLSANLNVQLFEKAVNDVVQEHHILRTNYVDLDGEGRQKVHPFEAFTVPVEAFSESSDNASIEALMRAEANTPFDLQHSPRMLRVKLLQREKHDDYLALFTVHHIAFDAFSNVTFLQVLNQKYSAYLLDGEAVSENIAPLTQNNAPLSQENIAPLSQENNALQFADYALWQRDWLQSDAYQAQADYWQATLNDAPASLNLPTEFRRPLLQTHEGDQASIVLPLALSNRIRDLVGSADSTLYMVMLAGFNLLLSRYAQQSDISVGTSVANRSHAQWQNMLGFFVNTLVMRNQVDESASFASLLTQVKATAADAYSHQDMPFDKLVELLDIDREDNQSPLFQVMFVLNNALDQLSLKLADVDVSIFATPLYHARFDLTLRVTEGELASDDRRIRCDMEFNTALYSKDFVQNMLAQYQHLLSQAVEQYDAPLKQLNLLPPQSVQQVLSLGESGTQSAPNAHALPSSTGASGVADGDVFYRALSKPSHSIAQQFEYWAAHQPDYPALRFQGQTLTYGELNARANVLAHHLLKLQATQQAQQDLPSQEAQQPQQDSQPQQAGLQTQQEAQQRVGIFLTRSPEFIVSLLAIVKAGAAYVPLDTQWPADRLNSIIKDSGIRIFLSEKSLMMTEQQGQWVDIESVLTLENSSESTVDNTQNLALASTSHEAQKAAYLIYTSGSTGEPKGVVLTQGNVLHYIDGVVDRFQLAGQSFALISTVAADLGNTAIYGALCFGGTLEVISEDYAKDAGELAQYLGQNPVDVLKIVPSHLQGLMSALDADDVAAILPTRCLIVGGEASALTFIEQVQKHCREGCRIVNHYGPTETTVGALAYEFAGADALPKHLFNDNLPIGYALPGNRVYVVGEHNQLCPVGVPGELLIAGAGVAQGYHQRDALNQERFVANPFLNEDAFAGQSHSVCYRTGDKVRLLASGHIEFLGRLDDQVKIRGYRVELGEVESVIRGLDDIQQAAVMVTQNSHGQNQLVGYIVLQSGVELAQVKAAIDANLADYMVPQHLITLDALPVTPNGKLDRRQLPNPHDMHEGQVADGASFGAASAPQGREPRNENEQILADIWCQVLRTDSVTIDDNFFDIGGDSILSLQIIARAKKAGLKITPKQLFQQKTIAALAEVAKPIAGKRVAGQNVSNKGVSNKGVSNKATANAEAINQGAVNQSAVNQVNASQAGATGALEASASTAYSSNTNSLSTSLLNTGSGSTQDEQPFAFTPIQRWFFEGNHPEPHHWNQSVLLASDEKLNFDAMQWAMKAILRHHDALSLSFTDKQQAYTALDKRVMDVCERIELPRSGLDSDAFEQALYKEATRVQQSLNLESGPALRVALFEHESSCHVLIVAHHLVVDGVSWRILLADLQQAYQQALVLVLENQAENSDKPATHANTPDTALAQPIGLDQSIELDHRSDSFKAWSEALTEFARSPAALKSLPYWTAQHEVGEFPVQYPGGENRLADMQSVERKLSPMLTQQLLKSVPAVYRTQISDILVTALAQQLARVTQNDTVLVELEGHGREDLIAFMNESISSSSDDYIEQEALDLSRTVGWFTSRYPVYLELPNTHTDLNRTHVASNTASVVKSIKEQLRAVPHKGVSFGVMRYLAEQNQVDVLSAQASMTPAQLQALKQRQRAPISFNYLGQFDLDIQEQGLLKPSDLSRGVERCDQGQRGFLIDINALIQGGELSLVWHYSDKLHDAKWIESLADNYIQALTQIINDVVGDAEQGINGVSPSDFPLAQLAQPQLDDLALDWGNVEALYPLTPMQEGLLFHTLMNPNTGIYFMQYRYALNGEFDHQAFTQAWQRVVQRHDVLRTAFLRQDEKALQVVYRHVPPPVEILDWRHLSEQEQQAKLPQWMSEQLYQGFDLSQPTQLSITLIQTHDDKYQLIRSFHHILTDAWCFSLIMMDFLSYYHAIVEGKTLELPAPRPFEDYVAWLQVQDIEKAEQYWRETLAGFEAPTALGVESTQERQGVADALCHLSEAQTQALQSSAQKLDVTLNTLVQAAWGLTLSRYSGDSDVVFGVTVAGRPTDLEGAESTVGLFINTLPLRMQVNVDSSLRDYVQQIFQTNINMREHEFAPLVDIQRWSDVPPGSEMFNSLFVYENAPIDPEMYKKLSILEVGEMTNRTHTNYPITVVIFPQETLGLQITYDKARFDDVTAERMLQHFKALLLNLGTSVETGQSDAPLLGVEMLSPQEQTQQLVDWNQTHTQYPREKCWPELFVEQVKMTPASIAVECEGDSLTYAELFARSQNVAKSLLDAGVKANDIVAVLDERGVDLLVMIAGILTSGAAYLPLDPKHPEQRVASILALSQPKAVLGTQANAALLTQALTASQQESNAQPTLILLDDIAANATNSAALAPTENALNLTYHPNDLAYVIYTSGSTGVPKGAMVEHLGMLNNLYSKIPTLSLTEDDVIAQTASQCFDISVWQFLTALVCGAKVQIYPDDTVRNPAALLSAMDADKVSILEAVPSLINSFIDDAIVDAIGDSATTLAASLTHLRWLMPTGEALSSDLVRRWFARHPAIPLINAYGPAECADDVSMWKMHSAADAPNDPVPIGTPTDNNRLYVLDAHQRMQPVGVMGEVYVAGAGVGRGYLNDAKRSAEAFIDNALLDHPAHPQAHKETLANPTRMYRTGDLARWRSDGVLEYLGRTDHQVKIRGFRIELGEIEACLEGVDAVRYVAVVVKPDPRGADAIVAYFEPQHEHALDNSSIEHDLAQAIRDALPEYMMPSLFVSLPSMPLSRNGKIDRKALPDPSFAAQTNNMVEAQTQTELALVPLWQQILQLDAVDIHASFFALGGHSLLAAQLHARVCQQFEVDLPLRTLFEQNSLAQVAQQIDNLLATQNLLENISEASGNDEDVEEFEL